MKCPICGTEYPAGSAFCTGCGNPVQPPVPPQSYQDAYQAPPYRIYDPASELVRANVDSKMYLAAAILLSIATLFNPGILTILSVVGVWMLYAAAKNKTAPQIETSSLSLLKVLATINYVLTWIGFGFFLLLMLLFLLLSGTENDFSPAELAVMLGLFLLIFIPVAVPSLVVHGGLRKTFASLETSVKTGTRPQKISRAAGIAEIIIGALGLLGTIGFTAAFGGLGFFASGLFSDALKELNLLSLPLLSSVSAAIPALLFALILTPSSLSDLLFGILIIRLANSFDGAVFPMDHAYAYGSMGYQNGQPYQPFNPNGSFGGQPPYPPQNGQNP